ncbi:hypothetical protein VB757_12005 [Synechococcus sp. BA-132 BA5]|nr:hypothetical protein [Synechococcus sp. BA-132 BA5]MEA5415847.1 hypothetical protein [Synechococcus sp. BA-132 BA5]
MQTTPSATACAEGCAYRNSWGFLRQIERAVPEDLDIQQIVENNCSHKQALDCRSSAQRCELIGPSPKRFCLQYIEKFVVAYIKTKAPLQLDRDS